MKGPLSSLRVAFRTSCPCVARRRCRLRLFNVLADAEVREIKTFSDWPTIQLYVDREFVGGCDIVTSMHQDGELATLFQEAGIEAD